MADMRLSQLRHSSTEARDGLAQSAEELFKIADVDKSGKIDFSEFVKLHALMKGVLTADYKKEEALRVHAARSKRRLKLTACLLAVMAFFFVLSTLANATAMYVIVDSQVTTTANTSSGQLTTKGGDEVSTLQGGREVPLGMLPFMPLFAPTEAMEAAPELIVLKDPSNPLKTTAFKVASISFAPPKTLEIATLGGERIVINGACKGYIYPADWATPEDYNGTYTDDEVTAMHSAFMNPSVNFQVPGTVEFCAACSTVQLKSVPNTAAMLAARERFNQEVARIDEDSEEAALCVSDYQVGSQLDIGSVALAKVDALPALCHAPDSETTRRRRELQTNKARAARMAEEVAEEAAEEARELITMGNHRMAKSQGGGASWEDKCKYKLNWKKYETPSCQADAKLSGSKQMKALKKCCKKWTRCSFRKCKEDGGPDGRMSARDCKRTMAFSKRDCQWAKSTNFYVTDTDAIDDVKPEEEEVEDIVKEDQEGASDYSTHVMTEYYKYSYEYKRRLQDRRRLNQLTEAGDGCITLQEMLWNGGSELFASFATGNADPSQSETTTKFCACCTFTHYVQDTAESVDPCVAKGAIGTDAFVGFLNGLGDGAVDEWIAGVDDWDKLESEVENVAITGTVEQECDADMFQLRDRRSLVNGRELYHSSYCPSIGSTCHPASTLLERADGSAVRIDEVQVGEMIKTRAGFETVTALMHAEHGKPAEFQRFHTAGASMAISRGHYLYVNGEPRDPASVKLGEMLTTSCCGEQPIERIEQTIEEGKFHLNTDSATYYADGVLASTYVAYVPLNVWKVAGALYPRMRYSLGVPITPEGAEGALLSIFWLVDVYEAMGMPHWARGLLWPITMSSTLFAELLNTAVVQLPKTTVALALAAAATRARK